MELKSIEITNFMPYFEKNQIDFASTTTIVIGQNNTGKSKLFDAVNFALYGRIFYLDKGENGSWITDDKEIASIILNTHKRNLALQKNEEKIEVSVSLSIDNYSILLRIERTFIYKRTADTFEYTTKNITLAEIDKLSGVPLTYFGDDAINKMENYFPNSIRDFFLFQGEAASRIMQLQKGGNFRKAVKDIARLYIFEEAKESAKTFNESISRRMSIKTSKNKKNQQQQEDLQNQIDREQERLDSYNTDKDESDSKVAQYSTEIDKLELELTPLKEFENYFNQKETLKKNSKQIEQELKNANNEKTEITLDAVFYKVREKINSFKNFYSKLEKQGEVPPSISPSEIKKALELCRCTICNSDLSDGTEARKFAEARLPKCDTDKLGKYLRDLNSTLNDSIEDIERIPSILEDLLTKKRTLEEKKAKLVKDKEELNTILEQIPVDESQSQQQIAHIKELKSSVSHYTSLLDTAKMDSVRLDGQIKEVSNRIFSKIKERDSIIVKDDTLEDEDKITLYYASKLNTAMNKLFEIANTTAYEQVQKRADEYYKEMTNENAGIVGDIKIDLETSEIYTVDENGNRIRNINQGNKISIQLAIVAGILTVAQEQFGVQYPFVTDAPVSTLGGDNKLSTIETMINAFEQSVIIIKDDTSTKNKTNDELRKLVQDSADIGIAYELRLSKADKIEDQYTEIVKIKG